MSNTYKYRLLIFALAIIKLVIPFLLQHPVYELHRDEYLYLQEGHHMAWGYMEIPPLLSVFAWLANLFGGSMFWVKIWPALFGALTFFLVARIVVSMGGKIFAIILGWLPFMLDGYMRLFFLFMPNFLDVFFWTLIAFAILRYSQTQQNKWLYIFGIAVGLGMMSKYSVAFYTISILAACLLTTQRKIFTNKHFYFAMFIALLIFIPNIMWQYLHRFPIINHMEELQQGQLRYNSAIGFTVSQIFMNLPCLFIWIAGLIYVMFNKEAKLHRLFAWTFLLVIALLIVLRGKDYYALGAYPVLFAFGAFYLEKATSLKWRWVRYAMIAFAVPLGLYGMPLTMPIWKTDKLIKYYEKSGLNKTGSFKWEDQQIHPLPQDFADMIGWREMALKAGAVYNSLTEAEREKTFVYCRAYYSAGALNYYRKEAGLPEVYSDNASFLFWMPEKYDMQNLILVAHNIPEKDDIVFQQFEKMTLKDSMNMPLFRETGMKIILYEHGNDSLNIIVTKGVADLKNRFRR